MARTIGHHFSGLPTDTWTDTCDFCGCPWPREKMILDDEGFLRCPRDRAGRSAKELSELAAFNSAYVDTIRGKTRGR